jgi:hypothetical protein
METKAARLRIFMDQSDEHDGRPLYSWILDLIRERGLAGATVTLGTEGIGADRMVSVPVVIEVVDDPDRIEALLPELAKLVGSGIATIDEVRAIRYEGVRAR